MSDRAALELTVAMPGLSALTVGLSRLRTDISDWTDYWRDTFGPFLYADLLRNFVTEGGNSGARWAPLSPAYAAWKTKRFPGSFGILVRSGVMKASLLGPDAPFAVFRPTSTALEIGTSVPYASYHQWGTSRMPQRPPLRVDDSFMRVAGKSLQAFIQRAWVKRREELIGLSSTFVEGNVFGVGGQ